MPVASFRIFRTFCKSCFRVAFGSRAAALYRGLASRPSWPTNIKWNYGMRICNCLEFTPCSRLTQNSKLELGNAVRLLTFFRFWPRWRCINIKVFRLPTHATVHSAHRTPDNIGSDAARTYYYSPRLFGDRNLGSAHVSAFALPSS